MDLIGLLDSINNAALNIDYGRKGFATRGKEQEGRIAYEKGITEALSVFKDVRSTADPKAIILIEYTFLSQELQFCHETDTDSRSSLNQAIQSFNEAFLTLEIVEDSTLYQAAEKTYPHKKETRESGFPKDAYHNACSGHRTRLHNVLRAPGIDPIEKALLKQRYANLSTAKTSYIEKQKKALANLKS